MMMMMVAAIGRGARGYRQMMVAYEPRNPRQMKYKTLLEECSLVVAEGPAGTGKTAMACQHAISMLEKKRIRKVVITRPTIGPAGEEIGFLKGDLRDKMLPWMLPILDVFHEIHPREKVRGMLESGVLEIVPLCFMRGRTFKGSLILADEMQNATPAQVRMLLTRLGEGSRMVLTGDGAQSDLIGEGGQNGLTDLVNRLHQKLTAPERASRGIGLIRFEPVHVERHPLLTTFHELYE